MNEQVVEALKKRYSNLYPLVFQRSLDHAKSDVDLFDILDSFPEKYPVTWDNQQRCWVHVEDLFLSNNFKQG